MRLHGSWFWGALLGVTVGAACGPSLRMVHQSQVYFERCHAAELDATATPEFRRQCWAAWLEHYRDGQPPERILYAQGRVRALRSGATAAPSPFLRPHAVSYTAAFLTSDAAASEVPKDAAHSPEPPGAEAPTRPADPQPEEAEPDPPESLGTACGSICQPRLAHCEHNCEGHPHSCIRACAAEHRICLGGCH